MIFKGMVTATKDACVEKILMIKKFSGLPPTAAIRKVWKSKQFPAEVCTGINIIIIAGEKMFLTLIIVISYSYGHYGNDHFDDCYDRAMILPMCWNNL